MVRIFMNQTLSSIQDNVVFDKLTTGSFFVKKKSNFTSNATSYLLISNVFIAKMYYVTFRGCPLINVFTQLHDSVFEAHPLDFWVVSMRLSNHFSSSHESWPWILLTQWLRIHFEDAFSFSHVCVFMINFFNFDCGRPKTTRHFYPQLYGCHHIPLLIRNCSWILTVHKDIIFWKRLPWKQRNGLRKCVKNLQTVVYNGARTIFEFITPSFL